jgi:hypothetical protein
MAFVARFFERIKVMLMNNVTGFAIEAKLNLRCPNCKNSTGVGLPSFFFAIHRHEPLVCVHCNGEFDVQLICLTRAGEQRHTPAETSGGLALQSM